MFVKFNLIVTTVVGCDTEVVYELTGKDAEITEDALSECALDLARDNAEMYGIEESEFFDDPPYEASWEILDGTREEIEEDYGEILPW